MFKRCQRLHTSDGDKAQGLAERIVEARSKTIEPKAVVPTFRAQCVTHKIFHIMTIGMSVFSTFVSGQIKLALSLRGAGAFTRFKKLLWTWLLANHTYTYEDHPHGPGKAADDHREKVYKVYFQFTRGRKQRPLILKIFILKKLANGDIRIKGHFQHFCQAGCCRNKRHFLNKLRWVVTTITGRLLRLFPRSRWVGMDESIDWIGAMTSIHHILPTVYSLWYAQVTGRTPPTPPAAHGGPADFACIVDAAPGGLIPNDDGADDPNEEDAANDGVSGKDMDPKKKLKTRTSASMFVAVPSLGSIAIGIRMLVTPVINMMYRSIDQGGAKWEKLQYARGCAGKKREYRGTNAALCVLENECIGELKAISDDRAAWEVVLPQHRSVSFRNQKHRLSGALACGTRKKLTDHHLDFPWMAFLWLVSSTPLDEQYRNVKCKRRLGHWFHSWCEYFNKTGRLGSREARADLEAHCILIQEDMASIEAKHAATRRELYLLSTQTNTMQFDELSDRHVLRCVRRDPFAYGTALTSDIGITMPDAETSESAESASDEEQSKRRVGPYRKWLSKKTLGNDKGCCQKGMGGAWAALPSHVREQHERESADALKAIQAGGTGYPSRKRVVDRDGRKNTRAQMEKEILDKVEFDPDEAFATKQLRILAVPLSTDFDEGVRLLRRHLRHAFKADTITMACQNSAIANYDERSRRPNGTSNGLPAELADAIGPDWRTIPHSFLGNLKHMRGSFPLVGKVVGTLMSTSYKTAVPRKLAAALRDYRAQLLAPANHDEAPKVSKGESTIPRYYCNLAGFCVHGSEGILVHAMHNSLLRALCAIRVPQENKRDRKLLANSNLIMCAVAEKSDVIAGPFPLGAAPGPIVTVLNKWAFLGTVDLSLRGFQSQLLSRVDGGVLCLGSLPASATLERDWTFNNAWDFVRYLDKSLNWCIRVFTFEESSRLVGNLDINICSVQELEPWPREASLETPFWHGNKSITDTRAKERNRRRKKADGNAPASPKGNN